MPRPWSARRSEYDRPRLYFFNLVLAETAVLGAFCAQDLALFVIFFDLMLVPFYFLIGAGASGDRVRATTKFVIYTLVGSLLMLAGAVALGVLATPDGRPGVVLAAGPAAPDARAGHPGLDLPAVRARVPGQGAGVPAARLGARRPTAPRRSRCWCCSPRSLSKVGVYGFLRIVLPMLPDAAHHFQEAMIVIAVVSILYGSVLAFSQDVARLVVAYSSIAQLGFITLGIFSLDPKGAQGALMQMVNHGLVVVAAVPHHRACSRRAPAAATRSSAWAASPSGRPCWRRCS